MRLDITDLFNAMSFALDAVETEAIGTTSGHGKRVAYFSMKMMRADGISGRALADLTGVAMLHDNAVSEYLREEYRTSDFADIPKEHDSLELAQREIHASEGGHWVIGERNIRKLPFRTDIRNIILCHHETADGRGPLGRDQDHTRLGSQIIFLADTLDMRYDLRHIDEDTYVDMCHFVEEGKGTLFSDKAVSLFFKGISYHDFAAVRDRTAGVCLKEEMPTAPDEYTDEEIKGIAAFFASIVDYKSSITKDHSMGVAAKAEVMAKYYGWPDEKVTRYYFAGAFHDIGKLMVSNDILEKPDKLDRDEFAKMATHAQATRFMLEKIKGLEDITEWAANHHEKLDGSGYPNGLTARLLTFEDRLMACIDIYQALTEERPYKKGLGHNKAISIMRSMSRDGKIDAGIVEDMDEVFGQWVSSDTDQPDESSSVKHWKCPVCGYIYEGEEPPKECPICGAAGYRFEPVG